jgi:hypothetical protein
MSMATLAPRIAAKRSLLAAAVTFVGFGFASQPSSAGPLCDWLFGRQTVPLQPYAAGYPVAVAHPGSMVPAATAPIPAAPFTSFSIPVNGASALQMPGYSAGFGTFAAVPATGPGDRGYAMFSPPAGTQFPASSAPQTAFWGTSSFQPTNSAWPPHQAGYGSVAPVTAYQAPITAGPSTVQTYPGIPASSPGCCGGIARFFASLCGTGYQSSYYRAPVTYYRPVTTTDALSGGTTIVQQPCSSYEYQLQRSPFTTFSPGSTAPITAPPANQCSPTTNYYNPYAGSVSPVAGYQAVPGNANFQPGYSTSVDTNVVPGQYYGPPASAPANTNGYYNGSQANPDNINVGQPALESSARPSYDPSSTVTLPPPPASWWSQSAMRSGSADSMALEKRNQLTVPELMPEANDPISSNLRPLPAGQYPYPRSASEASYPEIRTLPRASEPQFTPPQYNQPSPIPSTDDSQDRVAASGNAAFKRIQWGVQQASYSAPAPALPTRILPAPALPTSSGAVKTKPPTQNNGYQSSGWSSKSRR